MAKIAFIGAGSFEFTRRLIRDLLTYERLRDDTIALMDIDEERLGFSRQTVQRIVSEGRYTVKIELTEN